MSIAEQVLQLKQDFDDVYEAGYEKGKAEGGGNSWYDAFWDGYQDNGNRRAYDYAFSGQGWNNETFKPKYRIVAMGSFAGTFQNSGLTDFDFVEEGIELDTEGANSLAYLFRYAYGIKRIGVIDCTGCTELNRTFEGCYVETIDVLIVHENIKYSNTFTNCKYLTYITISGTIGNSISLGSCTKLSAESVQSIIDHLATVTTAQTITFHADVKAKLTDEQKATITQTKGWTLA